MHNYTYRDTNDSLSSEGTTDDVFQLFDSHHLLYLKMDTVSVMEPSDISGLGRDITAEHGNSTHGFSSRALILVLLFQKGLQSLAHPVLERWLAIGPSRPSTQHHPLVSASQC